MRNDRMQEGRTAVALAMVTPGYDQDPATGVADYASHHQDQARFEADKRAVYKHPLFPLLALLFERCEQATQSSDSSNTESFNMDIKAFVQHQERDCKPFLVNDPEIDGLMIKAIQVLRIHLLELEKVQELCKDFCNRYITCLKGKMQSENLLRSDYGHHGQGHDGLAPSSGSNGSSPLQVLSSTGNDVEPGANGLRVSRAAASEDSSSENGSRPPQALAHQPQQSHHRPAVDEHQQQQQHSRPASARSSSSGGGSGSGSGGAGGTTTTTTQHRRSLSEHEPQEAEEEQQQEQQHPLRQQAASPPDSVHGGTPLSQIGAHLCAPICASVNDMYLGQDITVAGSPSSMQSEDDDDACGIAAAAGVGSLINRMAKPKRGVLPKVATNIMRAWLFQHIGHPYPTEDEKRQISFETKLTLLQVNNWFINARRRILPPILDCAGATDAALQHQQHQQQQQQQQQQQRSAGVAGKQQLQHQQQRSKPRSSSKHRHRQQQQHHHQHQADWQSEDSGSESNGSSDGYGAHSGLGGGDRRTKVDDDEDSEDGGIDIEEQKPFVR